MIVTIAAFSTLGGTSGAGAAAAPTWRVQATVTVAGSYVELDGVACHGRPMCVAVGSAGERAFAERWNGHAWGHTTRFRVPGASFATLTGISCPGVADCVAVGDDSLAGGVLVEHWNGGTWSRQTAAAPAGNQGVLMGGISCTGAANCVAVGTYTTADATLQALILRWNGSTWTDTPTPLLNNSVLSSVSCPVATSCTAVGNYSLDLGVAPTVPLVEHFNGVTWQTQRAPKVPNTSSNELRSVSCTTPTACTAVGDWSPSSAATGTHVLVERYSGRSWRRQSVPVPAGAASTASLAGVTCPGVGNCTAVGTFGPNDGYETFAEQWNGKAWVDQSTPDVGAASDLASVACAAGTCRAVGSSLVGPDPAHFLSRPLAEVR